MSLQWVGQDDFAAGTLVGLAQDQQPGVGLESAINGLFDDDGDIWRRGEILRRGVAPAPAPLTFIWSGYLGTSYVVLVATATTMYAVVDDALVSLGGPGLAGPVLPAIVSDLLILPNGFVWGGASKATYNSGTVTVTQNSPIVTGASTVFTSGAGRGMLLKAGGGYYIVKSVDSNTQLTLEKPVTEATASGLAYTLSSAVTDALPATTRERHLGTAAGRLLIATDNRIDFSEPDQPFTFVATNYHELPDGHVVRGLSGIRDQALIFTIYGLWSISGMTFDLTDAQGNVQHELRRLTPEISLAHESGLAEWAGVIVAPCQDRIFLIDGLSPPVPISDSINSTYMEYVRQGYRPGGAKVFRNHYFLPILSPTGEPVTHYVCRLNRPVRARQVYYPWSEWRGYATGITALDVDLRAAPILRAVHKDGWRLDLTRTLPPFDPNRETAQIDPDGVPVEFDVETRDFPTGNGQPNHVRRLRLFYYVYGAGQIQAGYSYGTMQQRYREVTATGDTYAELLVKYVNYRALARGVSPVIDNPAWRGARYWIPLDAKTFIPPGENPLVWNFDQAQRTRYMRARFRSTDGIAQIKLRIVQFAVRSSTHVR